MPAARQTEPAATTRLAGEVDQFQAFYARTGQAAFGLAIRITGATPAAEAACETAYVAFFASGAAEDDLVFLQRVRSEALKLRSAPPAPVARSDTGRPSYTDVTVIRIGLQELGPLGRRTLDLAYFGGLGVGEIAQLLDEPVPVVRAALREALLGLGALVGAGEEKRP